MKIFLCLGNMEGSYRQKYVYLAFILILLTSLLFSAFTHACNFIVFISMLITLIVFILYVVLNPVFVYSLRIRVNLHLHRFLTILIFIQTTIRKPWSALNGDEYKSCEFNAALCYLAAVCPLQFLLPKLSIHN